MSEVHATLVKAKAYLLTHGWNPRGFGDINGEGGPVCAVGALLAVSREATTPTHLALMDAAGGAVMPWNDKRGRTFDEVIDLFDRAILATAPEDTLAPQPETASPSVTHDFA